MKWTEQQNDAICARNSSLIVSAGAGSGKTAVLTERIVGLLSDAESGVRADRIIAVTFTNDASAELKKRLDSKLRERINENPTNSYLIKQQTLLQSAKISTINAFCFELLRDNVSEQGITSGFSVLDESDENVLKRQAMDDLLDWYSKEEYEKISLLYDKFCVKNEESLIEAIRDLDNFLSSVAFRDRWLDSAVQSYSESFEKSPYFEPFLNMCAGKASEAFRLAQQNLSLIPHIIPDFSKVKNAKKFLEQCTAEGNSIKILEEIFLSGRLPDDSELKTAVSFKTRTRLSESEFINGELLEIYGKNRDKIKKIIKNIAMMVPRAESDYLESVEVMGLLAEVVRKYQEFVWERKVDRNALGFEDGERLVLEMLADVDSDGKVRQSETARRIAEYYDMIMVDEYQDSNNKQDMIFKLISKNFHYDENNQPMYGDNVFTVGDVKQSIYGFRLANPKNFMSTLESSSVYDSESDSRNQAVYLSKNFRSSEETVNFINSFFTGIMTEDYIGMEYDENEKLVFGADFYRASEENLPQITFITGEDPEDDNISVEAQYTAQQIHRMIQEKTPVTLGDGTQRPCTASDFCILIRGHKFSKYYVSALENIGISARGSEERGYLESREISVLINLLRIINNPLLDVPMTAVMTSPMYTFKIADIAYIKSFDNKRPLFAVLRDISADELAGFGDGELALRCRNFLESLDKFRLDSVTLTVGELINSIYDATDFIPVMQLYADGERKKANLRTLIQHAQSYEEVSSSGGGLNGFLRHIDRVLETQDYRQGKVSAYSGNYVTIQTFHASKGLEYPFVFIAETDVRFRFDSPKVICSQDGRAGCILYDRELVKKYKTSQYSVISSERNLETVSEEMRLLYVGLTRTRQKLFINIRCGEKELENLELKLMSGRSSMLWSAGSFADWLWYFLTDRAEFPEIAKSVGIGDFSAQMISPSEISGERLFNWSVWDKKSAEQSEEDIKFVPAMPDRNIVNELTAIISHFYDKSLSEMPSKLSVTQITQKMATKNIDLRLQRPKFISGIRRLTGSERGTALHTFFQYCDFEKASVSPSDEVKRLLELGYITKAQADSIHESKIKAFFNSELYERIMSAESYEREKKFMVSVRDLYIDSDIMEKLKKSDGMIKGIIDLMFHEKDGTVIIDYKSDRGVTAQQLKERYSSQLRLYKSAVETAMGRKVKEASIYSIELRKTIRVI